MKKTTRSWFVFLCCLLAMPTAVYMLPDGFSVASPERSLAAGVLLGAAHVVLRPVLRLVSAPIGCMTLGLFGLIIDVGLIYGCGALIEGFEVLSLPHALVTALFVDIMCLIVSGRK